MLIYLEQHVYIKDEQCIVYFENEISDSQECRVLFCSSVLPFLLRNWYHFTLSALKIEMLSLNIERNLFEHNTVYSELVVIYAYKRQLTSNCVVTIDFDERRGGTSFL